MEIDQDAFFVAQWAITMLNQNRTNLNSEHKLVGLSNLNIQPGSKSIYSFKLKIRSDNQVTLKR